MIETRTIVASVIFATRSTNKHIQYLPMQAAFECFKKRSFIKVLLVLLIAANYPMIMPRTNIASVNNAVKRCRSFHHKPKTVCHSFDMKKLCSKC